MARISRRRLRWIGIALTAVVLGSAALIWVNSGGEAPRVDTRDLQINVVDGPAGDEPVTLDATLYTPAPDRLPAPAIMVAHGFGGSKQTVADDARELAERGYVVLTWSARGMGRSGGQIALNSPDYEVADARQLVDWLADRSEVVKDGPDDPRVGVTGGSYGGALSLLLAGFDRRVDTLVPVITYNDLSQALLPNSATNEPLPNTPAANAFADNGVFKRSWAGIFFSAGMGGAGLANPTGDAVEPGTEDDSPNAVAGNQPVAPAPQDGERTGPGPDAAALSGNPCGRFQQEICLAYAEVATTGRASQQVIDLLRSVSPMVATNRITQPTLLVQGEQDTLFGLDQADANARQISAAGGPVKVIWYTGGHDGGRPGPELRDKMGDWFDFHLRGIGTDPGTSFEYAVQGALRAQGAPSVRTVTAGGYPGLPGATPTERRTLLLSGPAQIAVNPPGGNPASISNMPGLGSVIGSSSRLANRVSVDLPGQSARFTSRRLTAQLLIAGASTVRLRVAATSGLPAPPGGAVLFAKLYDVGPDGSRLLPGSAVSPVRVPEMPADGTPVEVTVTLPGIVRPVETDHRVELVVTTTDQAYATPALPAAYSISLPDDRTELAVPVVSGSRSGTGPPGGPLVGIAVVFGICVLAAIWGTLRRRRAVDVDAGLAGVPLVIENLSKAYPGGVIAVDDLSFRVERGQVLGLLGPNGAGKTTTLRMLMGLVHPTGGTMRVFGHKVYPGAPVLSRIGSFVEGPGFLPHLSGRANLELYWAASGRPAEAAHFHEALEIAGLGDAVHRRVRTYSQGMRQRLAIAQAMLGLPDLLVLDEPTNGLDPPQIHQMREVLRRYATTGRTVLVSSHLLAEVEQTCDHVVVMHRGKLVAAGAVEVIVAGGGEATFRVGDPQAAADVLRSVDGVEAVTVDGPVVHADLDGLPRSAAIGALVRAGVEIEQVGPRRRLEDAFLQLVGEEPS
ncbi:MAG TPA: alpha/beta fold hydrolase [Actinophytocola sp.]|uniref:alpha/beta fold hydrolase n=1 Tax=Actinophytocola sp. TaxID=1872138 RepID=UPI002DB63370|nr:alpha/beta fold hydrolase [Actinophytocola sp.]HEU5475210.1 alpha/beta fold hydrolase [Actinophytocola sp.]